MRALLLLALWLACSMTARAGEGEGPVHAPVEAMDQPIAVEAGEEAPADPSAPLLPVAEDASGALVFDALVVSGEQPGPGLWRVSKGEHVMWVIGTLTPLPRRMQWISREVEEVIANSQRVLLPPTAKLTKDIGIVQGAFLLPSAMASRKNPGKESLQQVVPPELYARWLALKERYIGRDRGVEKQRPLFAAFRLYQKAIEGKRLSRDGVVQPLVNKTAKRHKVPVEQPTILVDIGKPRQAIRDFAKTRLDDLDCFEKTLDRIEDDLELMRERANAWATGDIERLRELPFTDQNQTCADAILKAGIARERGLDDLRLRFAEAWLEAAERVLAEHRSSFAVLPMAELLKDDGYIATLRARGYEVEEP